ncbi:MAG: hypothetical protein F2796_07615, partial [Actinobacteria bacterium]|nr:hypothetical protein [Actinomycetota bacterium]
MPAPRSSTSRPVKKRPAAKPRAAAASRSKRPGAASRRLPVLSQRQLDLAGLGCFGFGVFLAFLLCFGWDGGAGGGAVADAVRWIFGQVAYAVPFALAACGVVIILRPVLPATRPLRAGAICLLLASTLAFAVGTLGLGSGPVARGAWATDLLVARGGALGELLFTAVGALAGTVGAHLLAVFLFLAGILLLTGASVAGILKATGNGIADTTRVLRSAAPSRDRVPEPIVPPEPDDAQLIVRPAAPDPADEPVAGYPGLFDEPSAGAPADAESRSDDATPVVASAASKTSAARKRQPRRDGSADARYTLPDASLLRRSAPD